MSIILQDSDSFKGIANLLAIPPLIVSIYFVLHHKAQISPSLQQFMIDRLHPVKAIFQYRSLFSMANQDIASLENRCSLKLNIIECFNLF